MAKVLSREVEIIVSTLLNFVDRVAAVDSDLLIDDLWLSSGVDGLGLQTGKRLSEIFDFSISGRLKESVDYVLQSGKATHLELATTHSNSILIYGFRVMPTHPQKELVFITIEDLSEISGNESENKRLKQALDATGDAVWDINYQNGTVVFSEKWQELFGYKNREITNLTQWNEKVHPDDLSNSHQIKADYLSGKRNSYAAEMRFLCRDGSYKWILSRGVAITRTSDGEPIRCIGTHTDISLLKDNERRITDLTKFYENILHNLPADIAVFDANHKYLFVNKHAFKNDELREFMLGKTDIDYARRSNRPDSFYKERFALYDSARDSKKQSEKIERMISKAGQVEYHLRVIKPVLYETGELEYLLAYGLNITDLIHAQQALKTSADTFLSAFENSGIGMGLVSVDGEWLDVNAAFCGMTGYSKEELVQLKFQDVTHPEDIEMDMRMLLKMLKKELTTCTFEKRYISKEKRIVLVLLTVSLVWNADGTPRFFIAQVVDITEKKELENEIKRKNNELEASKASLIGKVEQLEELSHIVAHNLRGPAGNIKMLAELLLSQTEAESGFTVSSNSKTLSQQQGLQYIQESSSSLIKSLSTLMEISEIKLNKEIPFDMCSLSAMISDVTTQLQSVIFEKKAEIKLELEIDEIRYPKAYLEHILYNLVSNALKYSRQGVPPQITISAINDGGKHKLVVKDEGLGINLVKFGHKIFKLNQVFHKGHDSKGIGLYITKTQVESLGGTIEVKSEENKGSEFTVTL